MKINIAEAVKNEGEVFSSDYSGLINRIEHLGETYDFADGVNVSCNYVFDGEGVSVMGSLEASALVQCSRCLKDFPFEISVSFSEYFKKQAEDGVYEYVGETIDLTNMLEDNIVLNLPQRHLCSEGCKGLCPKCGQNLNEGSCECKDEVPGSPAKQGFDEVVDETNPFYGLSKLNQDEEV